MLCPRACERTNRTALTSAHIMLNPSERVNGAKRSEQASGFNITRFYPKCFQIEASYCVLCEIKIKFK